ncbi:MAG: hypothetical protein KZQ58_04030 [gamma proteobacterium symbiont of Bathyaustriella thionipta]|nr:hypothetical protein [gamma proteobacterium symbiont of Bathyaustriella thionipta]
MEAYINVQMPDDAIEQAREFATRDDHAKSMAPLSWQMVTTFKEELTRVDRQREIIINELQLYSDFPLKHARSLHQLLYLIEESTRDAPERPFVDEVFIHIGNIGHKDRTREEAEAEVEPDTYHKLFDHYNSYGDELPLWQRVGLYRQTNAMLEVLNKHELMHADERKKIARLMKSIWAYKGKRGLSAIHEALLKETLGKLNEDKVGLTGLLARNFLQDYEVAEQQMFMVYDTISWQLTDTRAYILQIDPESEDLDQNQQEKLRIAEEKLFGLQDMFIPRKTAVQQQEGEKSLMELERTALGIPMNIEPEQIVRWIGIYSIVFSNEDFLSYAGTRPNFRRMRDLISNLSTYHLIQNIAELRSLVERKSSADEDEKKRQFASFNKALKVKLASMMKGESIVGQSIRDMIGELGFLNDNKVQFFVAETFKGFQNLVDAFDKTMKDEFVKDKTAYEKEARALYTDICEKALRNFTIRPPIRRKHADQKVSFAARLLSWFGVKKK